MKRKVIFIILEQFADWEYGPLAAALSAPETDAETFEVLFASDSLALKTSIGGLKAQPDITLWDIPPDAAALVLIGGNSWRTAQAQAVLPIARAFLGQDRVVGAICDAARFLGAGGLLNLHTHTGNSAQEMKNEPLYTNPEGFVLQDAVRDGLLVTANGNAPHQFAAQVMLALGISSQDVQLWYDFYTMGYYAAMEKYALTP